MDLGAKRQVNGDVYPKNLTVGLASRSTRDPLIRMLRQRTRINPKPYLDPFEERPESGVGKFRTPNSTFQPYMEARRSAPAAFQEVHRQRQQGSPIRPMGYGGLGNPDVRRMPTPQRTRDPRRMPTPQAYAQFNPPGFGMQQMPPQIPRPIPQHQYEFAQQGGEGYANLGAPQDYMQYGQNMGQNFGQNMGQNIGQIPGIDQAIPIRRGSAHQNFHMGGPARDRTEGIAKDEVLEGRIAALERDRRIDRVRSGLNAELRRLQSGVSPAEHPGIYSHVDKWVSLHAMPSSHQGVMAVAGATSEVLKAPHIKLAFLGEGVWEYGRRKCAEAGENLTEEQLMQIEAQIMEFYGKQKVEAGKILDKAGLTGRGTGR